MRLQRRHLLKASFLVVFLLISKQSFADTSELYVPEALRPWVQWVVERNPNLNCTILGKSKECRWPGDLFLELERNGGSFVFEAVLDKKTKLTLPGGGVVWPFEVVVDSREGRVAAVVRKEENRPFVLLSAGKYKLQGKFRWQSLPEALLVPIGSGLIHLTIDGQPVDRFKVSPNGELWLRSTSGEKTEEAESLRIAVQRKLIDGIPFRVVTRFELRVSGRAREVALGAVIPEGAVPISVESSLNYRFSSDGEFTLQVKPGVHSILITAVYDSSPEKLSPVKNTTSGWPPEEIWVWLANETIRSVELSGPPQIDSHRTSLPDSWKGHPTFILAPDSELTLTQTRRGEQKLSPNTLVVKKKIWLDLDGGGYTVRDVLSGTMNSGWRMNAAKGVLLGRVAVNGEDQLITEAEETHAPGVELREQQLNLDAESRMEHSERKFDAIGWEHDADSLETELVLPPGWTLLEAGGVDSVGGSWMSSWTLLNVFLVILIAVSVMKLFGALWGGCALAMLVLTHGESGAPFLVWFHLLAAGALLKAVPVGTFRKLVQAYFVVSFIVLAIIAVPFAVVQIQTGLFPQLGSSGYISRFVILPDLLEIVVPLVIAAIVCIGGIYILYLLIKRQWKTAFVSVLVAVCAVIALVIAGLVTSQSKLGVSREAFSPVAEYHDMRQTSAASRKQQMSYRNSGTAGAPMKQEMSFLEDKGDFEMKRQLLQAVDPKAVVQTGPGLPSWSWENSFMSRQNAGRSRQGVMLSWNGPVGKSHSVNLYLIGPKMNLLLSFLRVLLLVALGGVFLRFPKSIAAAVYLLGALIVLPTERVVAENPPSMELLKELEKKIVAERCSADCIAAEKVIFRVEKERLELEVSIGADGIAAWPLPGPLAQFRVESVRVDGEETNALRRDRNGFLWVRIPDGVHRVSVVGKLPSAASVTLQFAEIPGYVEVVSSDWDVDGLGPNGNVGSSLQFLRKVSAETKELLQKDSETQLPQWYEVKREIVMVVESIPWLVNTTVRRLGDTQQSQMVKLPLLAGEALTTGRIKTENGSAVVHFARGQSQVHWSSSFQEAPRFELVCADNDSFSEVWELKCSSIYRCEFEGIRPVTTIADGQHVVRWLPWPGEKVAISVSKPVGVEGQSVTVDNVELGYTPGIRLLSTLLKFSVRASQGGWQKVLLPGKAEVQEVRRDGVAKKISPKGRELALPLIPGEQRYEVRLRTGFEPSLRMQMPKINLGSQAVNVSTLINVPHQRWVLFATGPAWGPVFLYWGELLLILCAAAVLGMKQVGNLKIRQWVLLGLGLSSLPLLAIVVPPLWLVALKYRRERVLENRVLFNLFQVGLGVLTLAALVVLYAAVHGGLLGAPDMSIQGFGSGSHVLRWYVDRSSAELPAPSIVSVPLWVWRGLMFLWSSWLVYALIGWLKWGWECMKEGRLWWNKDTDEKQLSENQAEG